MIDRTRFNEAFQYYDKEVIIEVIGLFITDYPQRLADLRRSIDENDLYSMVLQAHSLKGLAGTFVASVPQEIAGTMEEMGKRTETAGLSELCSRLESALHELAGDLKVIREELES